MSTEAERCKHQAAFWRTQAKAERDTAQQWGLSPNLRQSLLTSVRESLRHAEYWEGLAAEAQKRGARA